MMIRRNNTLIGLVLLALAALPVFSQPSAPEPDTLYHETSARIMVKDRASAADEISIWAESKGGYFIEKTMDTLILRVPDKNLEEMKSFLNDTADEILDFSQSAFDLREDLLKARSSLAAREDLLKRNLEYLDQSDLEGTLTLELEIRRLMKEIDQLKGSLRKMENDSSYARVTLMLSFKNQSIPEGRPSRFEWINSVDFYRFMDSSPRGENRGKKGPSLPLPQGFALSSERPWFQTLSPEGVRLRLKSVKNYPSQSEDFWTAALFTRLEGLGYIGLEGDSRELKMDDGAPFTARRWGVPLGRQDFIYITALRLNGNRIEILEIGGEAQYLRQYF